MLTLRAAHPPRTAAMRARVRMRPYVLRANATAAWARGAGLQRPVIVVGREGMVRPSYSPDVLILR